MTPNRDRVVKPRQMTWLFAIAGLSLLLAGFVGYLLWRPAVLLMFDVLAAIHLDEPVRVLRSRMPTRPPAWLIYSGPYALWVYSWVLLMRAVWNGKMTLEARAWMLIVPAMAVAAEVMPLLLPVPGTYDPLDLVLISFAFPLAWVLQ